MVLIAILGITVMAQKPAITEKKDKKVEAPAAVKAAFLRDYTAATKVNWSAEGTSFEAEFMLNNVEYSAVYDNNGQRKEVEMSIKVADLTQTSRDYIKDHYAGYKITEASKITGESGNISYEAELTKGKEVMDVIFDVNGRFSKEVKGK